MKTNFFCRLVVLASMIALLSGCESRRERTPPPKAVSLAQADQSQYVVMLVLDLSGSFEPMMTDGGKAWNFTGMALDRILDFPTIRGRGRGVTGLRRIERVTRSRERSGCGFGCRTLRCI